MTGLSYNSTFKSPIISPESCFESRFYTRRFGPNESTYTSRFENRDPGRFRGIRKKNRPKRFHIENDSEKGVPFLADRATDPSLPPSRTIPAILVVFWGRRPGRNPSSVYYDGHPSYRGTRAIGRRLTGAYIPFHNTAEANVSS